MKIEVNVVNKTLKIDGVVYPCAIGKNGYIAEIEGREGDGKTPLGQYAVRYGFYREDRVDLPMCSLVMHVTQADDGWCDASDNSAYNLPVRLPYPASTEALYRDSHVYDIVLVLGHNDSPPIPDMGSAIFIHVARDGYAPTQGCVAVSIKDMLEILPKLSKTSVIEIRD
ncbi:MAG: hypothetical protein COA43_05720 [Robiginitomaculum sp.]|nr:MAG: hypothetical protein COA43_05720 [Robiginitomaculum sp.]